VIAGVYLAGHNVNSRRLSEASTTDQEAFENRMIRLASPWRPFVIILVPRRHGVRCAEELWDMGDVRLRAGVVALAAAFGEVKVLLRGALPIVAPCSRRCSLESMLNL